MNKAHAKLSPSSADRWTSCTASPSAQEGRQNPGSDASRQGTVCHQIQEECLLNPERSPWDYVGCTMLFWHDPQYDLFGECWLTDWQADSEVVAEVVVTEDMAAAVESAVKFIQEQHDLLGGDMYVESRVPIGQFTGEEGAHGSADVIILGADWIHVIDSKFGRQKVMARKMVKTAAVCLITGEQQPAEFMMNLQMACYALGAIYKHDVTKQRTRVKMTIVQPFVDHTDSYECHVNELHAVEDFLRTKAEETRLSPKFVPNTANCHFCLAAGDCQAQKDRALSTVFDGYGDLTVGTLKEVTPETLGSQYALLPFVRQWADDVEKRVREKLENGETVTRDDGLTYKLVPGRQGVRRWTDEKLAAETLRNMQLKAEEIYEQKLISPAQAEKLTKPKKDLPARLGPRRWNALQQLIHQGEAKPVIALSTDPRPSIQKAAGFEEVPTQDELFAQLFSDI